MSPLRSPSSVALLSALALLACKGDTVVKDNPETADKLKACAEKSTAKDALIASYEAEIAKLKLGAAPAGDGFTMVIEGEALAIKARPAGGGGGNNVDDKLALELSNQYIELVKKSRGNIQKCYEQALKKNTGLQARTIPMTVTSKFSGTGAVAKASFEPRLDAEFASCMQAVATRWKLPPTAAGMSFQSTVSLSPS